MTYPYGRAPVKFLVIHDLLRLRPFPLWKVAAGLGEQSIRRRAGDWSQRGGFTLGILGCMTYPYGRAPVKFLVIHDLLRLRPFPLWKVPRGGAGAAGRGGGSFQLGIFRPLGALGRAGQRNGDGLAVFSPPAGHSAAVSGAPRPAIKNQALAPKTCWRTMRI